MAARRVTTVSLVLGVVGTAAPISVAGICRAIPHVDRKKIYGLISQLCRTHRLEVMGREQRADGVGTISLYGPATAARVVPSSARSDVAIDPVQLAMAENYWRGSIGVGTSFAQVSDADIQQLRELTYGQKARGAELRGEKGRRCSEEGERGD